MNILPKVLFSTVISVCACSNGGGWFPTDRSPIDMDRFKIAPACAIVDTCTSPGGGSLSRCVDTLALYSYLPKFMLVEFVGVQTASLALLQNIDCVVEAGSDCDGVLACLNMGKTVRGCTLGFECVGSKLVACAGVQETFESTVDCASFGMECLTLPSNQMKICARQESSTEEYEKVTCRDNIAKIQYLNLSYFQDCNIFGGLCRPGVYDEEGTGSYDIYGCVGPGGLCDIDNYESTCDGNKSTRCYEGREGFIDCEFLGQTCTGAGACVFSDCAPGSIVETCDAGVITYCGLEGESTLDCTSLEFSGCSADIDGAWCTE